VGAAGLFCFLKNFFAKSQRDLPTHLCREGMTWCLAKGSLPAQMCREFFPLGKGSDSGSDWTLRQQVDLLSVGEPYHGWEASNAPPFPTLHNCPPPLTLCGFCPSTALTPPLATSTVVVPVHVLPAFHR
jgi:hypothetical protein